jgi:hypothetical protein
MGRFFKAIQNHAGLSSSFLTPSSILYPTQRETISKSHPSLRSLVVMSSTQLDDGRVGSRIENYSGFWQKDINKEAQVDSDTRVENYTDVVNGAAR